MRFALLVLLGLGAIGCEAPIASPVPIAPSVADWEGPGRHVVMFTSEHCVACQQQKPELDKLRRQGIRVWEIDGDDRPDLRASYNVTQYPTYLVFEDGSLLDRFFSIKTLIKFLKALKWLVVLLI